MKKNYIFDFGNVLVKFDPEYMTSCYTDDAETINTVSKVVFDRIYWDRLDRGTITDDECLEAFHSRLPCEMHKLADTVYNNWYNHLPEMEGMRELLTELKTSGRGLYLLSNISRQFAAHSSEIPILSFFDGAVYSAEVSMTKPGKDIFMYLLNSFSLRAGDCCFIDDTQKNIDGASECGIEAFLFDSHADNLRKKLFE